jgi:LPPG:FO 2-phospho-L-lactate transferase
VIGLSPIVGGRAMRGMAETCLATIGVPCTAGAVGAYYGARVAGGILDGWLVHTGDAATVPGMEVGEVPLLMTDVPATAAMAAAAPEMAGLSV